MLDTVTAATEEMAGAAGITAGFIDILSDILQVYAVFWMAGLPRRLAVQTGTVVAHQAVDIFFSAEVEALVFPAITDVTSRAVRKIGLRRDAEVIQDIALAKPLLVIGIKKLPGPVIRLVNLLRRFGMTCDTGPGDFGSGLEMLLQFLELGVVGRRYCICGSGQSNEYKNHSQ